MKLLNIKTFEDRYNNNKKFHHVNLLGLKFRIANNKRSSTKETRKICRTDIGLVWNVLPNRYICLIK